MSFVDKLLNLFKDSSENRGSDISVTPEIDHKLRSLKKILGFDITAPEYYIKALTHRSYIDHNPELTKSNERLEFLGDAVLDLIVSKYLFEKYKTKNEGELTKMRSHLVDKNALADAADRMKLGSVLLYNKKFIRDNDEGLRTIISDALEAVIGAIYLDAGSESTEAFIKKWIIKPGFTGGHHKIDRNFKGQLLEYTHANKISHPVYKLLDESGPQHDKIFTVEVIAGKNISGKGTGKSKKTAEQNAAEEALKNIEQNDL